MPAPPDDGGAAPAPRVILLTRPGCHLCTYAREAVARVAAETGVSWAEEDVTTDPERERDYGPRIPVVLVDGREHDYFRVDEARLSAALGTVAP